MFVYLRNDPSFFDGVMVRKTPTDWPTDKLLLATDDVVFGLAFAKREALKWVKRVQAGGSTRSPRPVKDQVRVQLGRIHTWVARAERGEFGDMRKIPLSQFVLLVSVTVVD